MKKILMLGMLFVLFGTVVPLAYSCPIDNPDACTADMKADIGAGINDKLPDKVVPNNLNKIIQPNNTLNNRTNLGQPSLPDNIKMRPIQRESTQPYNANCQFGNCMNNQETDVNKNE